MMVSLPCKRRSLIVGTTHILCVLMAIAWFGLCWTTTVASASASVDDDGSCPSGGQSGDGSAQQGQSYSSTTQSSSLPAPGTLRPSDLAGPVLFENFVDSHVVNLPGIDEHRTVNKGTVEQINPLQGKDEEKKSAKSNKVPSASVLTIPEAIPREITLQIRHLLEQNEYYDRDPDSVDGMPTFELFIDGAPVVQVENENDSMSKSLDLDPNSSHRRAMLRTQFRNLTQHYIEQVLTPLVRQEYPNVCQSSRPDRLCMPCHSLVRRYRHGERQSHATHLDAQALVTVVVSLSEYGRDYQGGLYVSTGLGQKEFLKLNEGDAAMHQSNLFHGVRIFPVDTNKPESTNRWSWIIWYKDSVDCREDFSHEWFMDCANEGDAVCQYLHSTKDLPGKDQTQETKRILKLTQAAAVGGVGEAAVKMAGGYLHLLPSPLPYNQSLAREFYRRGIQSHHPEAHYGLANLMLMNMENGVNKLDPSVEAELMQRVLYHLESAAKLGHAFSMFNLGIIHAFGYCGIEPAMKVSQEWFVESGLPEGMYIASRQAKALDDLENHERLLQHAHNLGWAASWRKEAREQTSSSGLSLNFPWPKSPLGSKPPQF